MLSLLYLVLGKVTIHKHLEFLGSIPNFTITLSPKDEAIQVGERAKHDSFSPSSGWMAGTIWIALDPLPIIPTRLLRRSKLLRG